MAAEALTLDEGDRPGERQAGVGRRQAGQARGGPEEFARGASGDKPAAKKTAAKPAAKKAAAKKTGAG